MSRGAITAPERITIEHDTAAFDSGEATLDQWLRKRALKNTSSGASRCFVICEAKTVVGYYSLSLGAQRTRMRGPRQGEEPAALCGSRLAPRPFCAGSSIAVAHEIAPKAMRRNMPDPLPAMLLGRLAVDRQYHNQGLGSALLRDAMLRTLSISQQAGVALMFVHALHDPAKQFYLSRGFVQSPLQPMTLMMTLATVQAIVVEPHEMPRAGQSRQR